MARRKTRNETIQALLEKVISNQEEFSKRFEETTRLSHKRKWGNVQDEDTQAKKKMDTREAIGRIVNLNMGMTWKASCLYRVVSIDTDLPLDAVNLNQASQLLEEQGFTDMLNKIPEDALNDLLSEHIKNEDFLPTEELETALSKVDKDYKQMGNTSYKDISYPLQADDSSAITSPPISRELNSVSQALSSMTLEPGPSYFTNLGTSQSQGPMDSRNDAHDRIQMTTSMQVGELTERNRFPADRAGNFLGSSTALDTQLFPRYYTRQSSRGPRRSRWPFYHAKGRHHSMVGPSQSGLMMNSQGYNQQLGTIKMGVGKPIILPNLAMMDHGFYHNQAMAQGNTTATTQRFQSAKVFIPKTSNATNAISCLNEICPGLCYQDVSRTGQDHTPIFAVAVSVNGVSYIGTGPNKKCAKHAAAEAALKSFARQ